MYVYLANYYCPSVELASDGETKRRAFFFIFIFIFIFILFFSSFCYLAMTGDCIWK